MTEIIKVHCHERHKAKFLNQDLMIERFRSLLQVKENSDNRTITLINHFENAILDIDYSFLSGYV